MGVNESQRLGVVWTHTSILNQSRYNTTQLELVGIEGGIRMCEKAITEQYKRKNFLPQFHVNATVYLESIWLLRPHLCGVNEP